MNNRKAGSILGVTSIVSMILSIVIFYMQRGPNADIQLGILVFSILSIIGIFLAVISWLMSKRLVFLVIGLLGNGAVLAYAFLLLLAVGISES
ncbi:hypothetical protein [Halalkalibacter akibai]|uniref:Uncharacterized protein n=1 Tax=Halalkalibacter akibai (strain ATCC 43226 / DSM 21942 / CIP 109018 / JCM 9157 / 1139) TaxID=1236973 RepID=W4QZW1_HALA3|nr:hypothetical protein [Halalkalibacter akibai]GAE37208.1 hypothetical protein JCM9157_4476 [Halalkalibacter akibai JCM 9157]